MSLCVISASYCMSQKTEKPILSGQRIKTRKRGELNHVCTVFVQVAYRVVCGVLDWAKLVVTQLSFIW